MKFLALAYILFVPLVAKAEDTRFHTDPSCWPNARYFHSGEENAEFLSSIKISRFTKPNDKVEDREWVSGPNGAYRFTTSASNPARPDTDTLLIFVERPYLIRLFVGDSGVLTELRWINEKLIFLRIWWGRVRASDIILDVEAEKIRLSDILEDGDIAFQQFQERCKLAGSKCECG